MNFSVRYLQPDAKVYSLYLQLPSGVTVARALEVLLKLKPELAALYKQAVPTKLGTFFKAKQVNGEIQPLNTLGPKTLLNPQTIGSWLDSNQPVWFVHGAYGVATDDGVTAKALYWVVNNVRKLDLAQPAQFVMDENGNITDNAILGRVPDVVQFSDNFTRMIRLIYTALGIDTSVNEGYAIDIADLPLATDVSFRLQQHYEAVHPKEAKEAKEPSPSLFWKVVKWTAIIGGGYYGLKWLWGKFRGEEEVEVTMRVPARKLRANPFVKKNTRRKPRR